MEDLTKHQIVLVTLLVTLVTSITTGIVTVSLVDQNTTTVPQVVNHVIERTIEKMVPNNQTAAVITKETIVVRSEDQAIAAINKTSSSLARIYSVQPPANTAASFLGLGVIVSKEGELVADRNIVSSQGTYFAVVPGGKSYALELKKTFDEGTALFRITLSKEDQDKKDKPVFAAMPISQTALHLGQSVLSVGGKTNINVTMGIVSEIVENMNASTTPTGIPLPAVKTDIDTHSTLVGSPLVNLSGELVGIKISKFNSSEEINSFYLPATVIASELSQ